MCSYLVKDTALISVIAAGSSLGSTVILILPGFEVA
jgi:hypothetical protein